MFSFPRALPWADLLSPFGAKHSTHFAEHEGKSSRVEREVSIKGKRSGARVIYLHVPEAKRFYMLDVYGKNEKDDLSADEKKHLRQLADQLKREAIAAYQHWLKENE